MFKSFARDCRHRRRGSRNDSNNNIKLICTLSRHLVIKGRFRGPDGAELGSGKLNVCRAQHAPGMIDLGARFAAGQLGSNQSSRINESQAR